MSLIRLAVLVCVFVVPAIVSVPSPRCPPCPCADSLRRPVGNVPGFPFDQGSSNGGNRGANFGTRGGRFGQNRRGGQGSAGQRGQGFSGQRSSSGQGFGGQASQGGHGQQAPSNPPDAVAFFGTRSSSQYFFQASPVIFDNVITNIGGGYDGRYGVFTAFESGIYLVKYHVVSQRNGTKNAEVDLLRNNEVINSASGRGLSGETSNSAVVFLNRFDQLSVQGRAESAIFCGEGGDALCSFSVVLIKIGSFTDSKEARPVPGW